MWRFGATIVAAMLLLFPAPFGRPAQAAPKIVEKTEYYAVSGTTGRELLVDMNRKGPRQGFLTKAIAQTRYETSTDGDLVHAGGVCRVAGGGVVLTVTYIYPKPSERLGRDLARRWKAFQADNVRHERMHGRIAAEFAARLERYIDDFAVRDGRGCGKARALFRRETKALYRLYEQKQIAFDRREHRANGPVDRSVALLLGDD